MKTKKIICIAGYGIALAVTAIGFAVCLKADIQAAQSDDIFGTKLTVFFELLAFLPIVIAESDTLFSIWHFLFCKHKDSKSKKMIHIICCCLSGLSIMATLFCAILYVFKVSVDFTIVFYGLLWYALVCVLFRIAYGIVAMMDYGKNRYKQRLDS